MVARHSNNTRVHQDVQHRPQGAADRHHQVQMSRGDRAGWTDDTDSPDFSECLVRFYCSDITRSWLGIGKSIGTIKNLVLRCGRGYSSGARCQLFACDPADATATSSPLASLNGLPLWCQYPLFFSLPHFPAI